MFCIFLLKFNHHFLIQSAAAAAATARMLKGSQRKKKLQFPSLLVIITIYSFSFVCVGVCVFLCVFSLQIK